MNPIVPYLLPLQLRYVRDFTLAVDCTRCAETRVIRVEELAAEHGDKVQLADMVSGLRCATCGKAPSGVRLRARGEVVGIALIE